MTPPYGSPDFDRGAFRDWYQWMVRPYVRTEFIYGPVYTQLQQVLSDVETLMQETRCTSDS